MKTNNPFKSVWLTAICFMLLVAASSTLSAQDNTDQDQPQEKRVVKMVVNGDENTDGTKELHEIKIVACDGQPSGTFIRSINIDTDVEIIKHINEKGDMEQEIWVLKKKPSEMMGQHDLPDEVQALIDKEGGEVLVKVEVDDNDVATKVVTLNGKEVHREVIEDFVENATFYPEGYNSEIEIREMLQGNPQELEIEIEELKETLSELENLTFDIKVVEDGDDKEVRVIKLNGKDQKGSEDCIKHFKWVTEEEVDLEEIEEFMDEMEVGQTFERVEETITEEENGEKIITKTVIRTQVLEIEEEEVEILEKEEIIQELEAGNPSFKLEELPLEEITFYPNPNNGQFKLNFTLPEKGKTTIRITDVNGKTVYEEVKRGFKGNYQGDIDISDKDKGVYFLQITQGDKSMSKKVIVQ